MAKQDLADRVRIRLTGQPFSEQKMFGGICFMLNGNMLVGASPRGLMVRVGKDANDDALARPHTRPMEQSTRTMPGYVIVDNDGLARDEDLQSWLDTAIAFVSTLPPKEGKAAPKRRRPARSPSVTD
jgi:TfoX/Sxy family transcriptional regulator of competence genes